MQEAQHLLYAESSLCYFHSRNYIKNLLNRYSLETKDGFFIDLLENELNNKPGFINIIDSL